MVLVPGMRRWMVVAVGLIIVVHIGLRITLIPQYRTELGGVEHNVVYGIQKILLGLPLYQDPEQLPFDVIQYTPAYYGLGSAVGKVLGVAGDDARAVFVLSRVIGLILTLATCWIVYRLCLTLRAPPWAAVFAAGLTCCAYTEHFYARPDALQSFASLTAVWFFVRWLDDPRMALLLWCSAFAVIGSLAKQSGILVLGLPALHLLVQGQWRPLAHYATISAGFLLLGLGAIFLTCPPQVFWQNTVQGLANGFSPQMWQELFDPPTYKYFVGWHLLAILIIVDGLRSAHPGRRFLALAVPLSVVFGLVTGLKYGSRLNYLHEGLALTFMGTAVLIGSDDRLPGKKWGTAVVILYGLVFMAFRTNVLHHWSTLDGPESARLAEYKADRAVRDVLVNDLDLRPGEYVFITYRDYLEHLLVGQSVLTQKDIIQFSKKRLFDYTAFHGAMSDGTVRFVITDRPDGPVSYLDSTYAGWVPLRTVEGRTILGRASRP
ncbi:MAG TPA: glycosyltransferase family 39 protein [Flavobacteriales bacterium]|nr:glycosyltransferase family 39 protein [Flavobacteriales bacterium]